MQYPINDEGVALLKEFESFKGEAYLDMVGVWTIGWGFTKGVKKGDRMTLEQGNLRLANELEEYTAVVRNSCKVAPTSNELAGMVVLAWNIGLGWDTSKPKPKGAKDGFRNSTVLRAHNRGDRNAAARAFGLWNKATVNGKQVEVAGLTRRRAAESVLYLKPGVAAAAFASEPTSAAAMPQAVSAETKPSASPTALAGAGGAAAGALGVAAQVSQQVGSMQSVLGPYMPYIALAAAVITLVAGAIVIYYRFKQRKAGWV